ncbi:aspartyl protease family protein At5g10770-like, partial [Panicum virgatum]|uniref:aspartyl protease family protein At5g10770-like n=1 Tax=Panicum virgatum TaxID=38727 RepID=UPI0019D5DB7D
WLHQRSGSCFFLSASCASVAPPPLSPVATSWLKTKPVCQGLRVDAPANLTASSWVPLSHSYGPCSAAAAGSWSTPAPADVLLQDQRRAGYIQRKLAGSTPQDDNGSDLPESDCKSGQSEHAPTIQPNVGQDSSPTSEGSEAVSVIEPTAGGGGGQPVPGVKQTMVLDTASDVAWVQCAPCPMPQCHPQTDTIYDPSQSSTYAPFACGSPVCRQLGPYGNGCAAGSRQCQYRVLYPDGRSTMGTYISDVLRLNPTSVIGGFQFGCSHAVQGHFPNDTAGIMALGRGAQSLASQTRLTYGGVFSYCLPRTASYSGFFVLGVPRVAAARYALTPMFAIPQAPMLYLVRLRAIVVAGQVLAVPPAVFAPGSVVDSRSVITRLPPTAYAALRAAFRARMGMYRAAPPKQQLDTCYDLSGVRRVTLPTITLVFDHSAAVELDPSGILYNDCLAFAPGTDDRAWGVIGNVQLQTYEVLYNVAGGAMGFRRAAC